MPTRILLADDHALFRAGVKALLSPNEFEVVAEANNGQDAMRLARLHEPEVALIDISMPGLNGVDVAREVLRAMPRCKVIMLTMHQDHAYLAEALRAGARGYILKSRGAGELVEALREVAGGGRYLSPGLSRAVAEGYLGAETRAANPLTPREREVLQLIAEGNSTKQVAAILCISYKTAESHRQRIMQKLEIHETASLVRYAIRSGIVQP